jgi:hypothetical protein
MFSQLVAAFESGKPQVGAACGAVAVRIASSSPRSGDLIVANASALAVDRGGVDAAEIRHLGATVRKVVVSEQSRAELAHVNNPMADIKDRVAFVNRARFPAIDATAHGLIAETVCPRD